MTYSIDAARSSDVEALPAIEIAAAGLFGPEDLPPALAADATPLQSFGRAQREGRLWVASCRTETGQSVPVGFALVELHRGGPHLQEIDVHPDHGNRGLGTALVEAVLDWAAGREHASVSLTTFDHIAWNRPFYEHLGFRVLGLDELDAELDAILRREKDAGLLNRVAMRAPSTGNSARR